MQPKVPCSSAVWVELSDPLFVGTQLLVVLMGGSCSQSAEVHHSSSKAAT